MKTHEKREFKSSGLIGLIGLLALSVAIIATPWNRHLQDARVESARQKAEVVGYQIVQIYRDAVKNHESENSTTRAPSSVISDGINSTENLRAVGSMGLDPWGIPFQYRIISRDGNILKLVVWSSGPNKKSETRDLENEDATLRGQPVYEGDDLGVILSVKVN